MSHVRALSRETAAVALTVNAAEPDVLEQAVPGGMH